MTIGVFFGSFNPVHLGHVAIAKRFLQEKEIDEVWLSVSPHNPLKVKGDLLTTYLRVKMTKLAVADSENIKVIDFEKNMPQPSYTYEALQELKQLYPQHQFSLLIGGDNCVLFDKWRNYDKILNEFRVYAYPRDKSEIMSELRDAMTIIDAPLLDFASTNIRHAIKNGKIPKGLDSKVLDFILTEKLYNK